MWLVREREREEEIQKQNEAMGIVDNTPNDDGEFKISFWDRLSHSNIFKGFLIILLIAILVPVLLFIFVDMSEEDYDENHTCVLRPEYRIPCGPQNITDKDCSSINCCFNITEQFCFHSVPSHYLYKLKEKSKEKTYLLTPIKEKNPLGKDNKPIYLTTNIESKNKVSFTLHDKPIQVSNEPLNDDAEFNYTIFEEEMSIEVRRSNSADVLLSTSHGPTIISDRYWEWTVDLQTNHLFGMDFLHVPENETVTRVVYKNAADHGSVPKFMAYSGGKYHGLEIDHSGPLEVTVLPSKLLVLRLLSGDKLTLHLSTGPSPADVLKQQRKEALKLPPYWALGVHMCRDGKVSTIENALKEYQVIFEENIKMIPFDSECIHDSLFSLSTTPSPGLENAIKDIQNKKKRFMMSLAPQISVGDSTHSQAEKLGILYSIDKKPVNGKYLGQGVAYPDYGSPNGRKWIMETFLKLNIAKIDGFVLRNDWSVNDNYVMESKNNFQYMSQGLQNAMSKTLAWNSVGASGIEHVIRHNSYGFEFAQAVEQIKPDFIMSASFISGSSYVAHAQNIDVTWGDYKRMLTRTLSHSLFGGPLYSTPVCGSTTQYNEKVNQTICLRWYLTAATLPIFRISSDKPWRDPLSLTLNQHVQFSAVNAIQLRYKFLPHFYTILSDYEPMIRPMFYNFPKDEKTLAVDEQYMIGDALLVAQPVLFPISDLRVYFPLVPGGWYEFWGGTKVPEDGWTSIPIVETDLVMFIRAGHIVPLQNKISENAEESRKMPFKLIIALNCPDEPATTQCQATGKLYIPNTGSLEFDANENSLEVRNAKQCVPNNQADYTKIDILQVYKEHEALSCPVNNNELCYDDKRGSVTISYASHKCTAL